MTEHKEGSEQGGLNPKQRNEMILKMLEVLLKEKQFVLLKIQGVQNVLLASGRMFLRVSEQIEGDAYYTAGDVLGGSYVDIHRMLMDLQQVKQDLDDLAYYDLVNKALLQTPDAGESLDVLGRELNLNELYKHLDMKIDKKRGGTGSALLNILSWRN